MVDLKLKLQPLESREGSMVLDINPTNETGIHWPSPVTSPAITSASKLPAVTSLLQEFLVPSTSPISSIEVPTNGLASINLQAQLLTTTSNIFPNTSLIISPDYEILTFFPKLPLELRLKVGVYSLPRGRKVDISLFINDYEVAQRRYARKENAAYPKLVTLQVNRESRTETLRHYVTIPRSLGANVKIAPFLFTPLFDIPIIRQGYAINDDMGNYTWSTGCLLSKLDPDVLQKCISKIQWLEVIYLECHEGIKDLVDPMHDGQHAVPPSFDDIYCCLFQFFPSLKKIEFLLDISLVGPCLRSRERRNEFLRLMDRILESHKKCFTSGKPHVAMVVPPTLGAGPAMHEHLDTPVTVDYEADSDSDSD